MKKLTAFFLALVMVLSLCSVTAFAEDETPINEVDLSSLNVGENWAGKTVSEVKSALGTFETDKMVCAEYGFAIKHDNNIDYNGINGDAKFESGETYFIAMYISAKPGYYFSGTAAPVNNRNYMGTIIPENVIAALVFENLPINEEPDPVQCGHTLAIGFEFTATAEESGFLSSVFSLLKNIVNAVFSLNEVIISRIAGAASAFKDMIGNIKFKFEF